MRYEAGRTRFLAITVHARMKFVDGGKKLSALALAYQPEIRICDGLRHLYIASWCKWIYIYVYLRVLEIAVQTVAVPVSMTVTVICFYLDLYTCSLQTLHLIE